MIVLQHCSVEDNTFSVFGGTIELQSEQKFLGHPIRSLEIKQFPIFQRPISRVASVKRINDTCHIRKPALFPSQSSHQALNV